MAVFGLLMGVGLSGQERALGPDVPDVRIAFLGDVHLQDIQSEFSDSGYKGVRHPVDGKYYTIRTMEAQLHSTRLFNENYFALKAALDEVGANGIKLVVFPGDFSDDGQPVNIRKLKEITAHYTRKYGMRFFATTGNHDPVGPFSREAGKDDFLGSGGQSHAIMSRTMPERDKAQSTITTADMRNWGYADIQEELSDLGFFPQPDYLYWATPFSSYSYETYRYDKASLEAATGKRSYEPAAGHCPVPDASYLVEPVEGLWLLALDGSVYRQRSQAPNDPCDPDNFGGAGAGYNNLLPFKRHLVSWVAKVVAEARKQDKKLIAFSHYPLVDYNDGASDAIKALFGPEKMQAGRIPKDSIADLFANAGLQVHFAGHMHRNDTGIRTTEAGNTLFNIQLPSLAAYPPAYKILKLRSGGILEVRTELLDRVANFNQLFPLYEMEHAHLSETRKDNVWRADILEAKSYVEFTEWHLRELVRLRFLPADWPPSLVRHLREATGWELLTAGKDSISRRALMKRLDVLGIPPETFESWTGLDLILDYYKLRNADELARAKIGADRLEQYTVLCREWKQSGTASLSLLGEIFEKTANGEPAANFLIDLESNTLRPVRNSR